MSRKWHVEPHSNLHRYVSSVKFSQVKLGVSNLAVWIFFRQTCQCFTLLTSTGKEWFWLTVISRQQDWSIVRNFAIDEFCRLLLPWATHKKSMAQHSRLDGNPVWVAVQTAILIPASVTLFWAYIFLCVAQGYQRRAKLVYRTYRFRSSGMTRAVKRRCDVPMTKHYPKRVNVQTTSVFKNPQWRLSQGTSLWGAWRDHCFPAPFSWFLHETGLGSLNITLAHCFHWNVKGKTRKRRKNTASFVASSCAGVQPRSTVQLSVVVVAVFFFGNHQFCGVDVCGPWRTAVIDRTTFHACLRCRKTTVFAVFSRLWVSFGEWKPFVNSNASF